MRRMTRQKGNRKIYVDDDDDNDDDEMMTKWWWKDEFVLGRIHFTCSECGNVKTCMLQINELFLCCLPLQCLLLNFVSIDYRKWLSPKKLFNFYLFLVSLGQVYFVLVLTLNIHKALNRYPEMVQPGLVETVYRPDSYSMLMSAHGCHCQGAHEWGTGQTVGWCMRAPYFKFVLRCY